MWAYGRRQTHRYTQTHRRAWPQYILHRLRLTQNVIMQCQFSIYEVGFCTEIIKRENMTAWMNTINLPEAFMLGGALCHRQSFSSRSTGSRNCCTEQLQWHHRWLALKERHNVPLQAMCMSKPRTPGSGWEGKYASITSHSGWSSTFRCDHLLRLFCSRESRNNSDWTTFLLLLMTYSNPC